MLQLLYLVKQAGGPRTQAEVTPLPPRNTRTPTNAGSYCIINSIERSVLLYVENQRTSA